MLCIRTTDLIYHVMENLNPFANISQFSHSPAKSLISVFILCFWKFELFTRFLTYLFTTDKWCHTISLFVWFISLSTMPSRLIHTITNDRTSFFLRLNNIPLYIFYIIYMCMFIHTDTHMHILDPFIHWKQRICFHALTIENQSCNEYGNADISLK